MVAQSPCARSVNLTPILTCTWRTYHKRPTLTLNIFRCFVTIGNHSSEAGLDSRTPAQWEPGSNEWSAHSKHFRGLRLGASRYRMPESLECWLRCFEHHAGFVKCSKPHEATGNACLIDLDVFKRRLSGSLRDAESWNQHYDMCGSRPWMGDN